MTELLLIANAGDGTISTLRLHRGAEARLEMLATSGDLPGCGTFALDRDRGLVHAAVKGDPAAIATLRLDRDSGVLTELGRRDVEASMAYLSLSADGRSLLGASYGGDFGVVWPVDGHVLGAPHSRFTHRHVHCIIPAVVGGRERVYAVALGDDLIAQFDLTEGRLTPLDRATVAAPAGSGPRHLVLDGDSAYLVTEFSGEAIRYDVRADGTLHRAEAVDVVDPRAGLRHSALGADPKEEQLIWGADVHRAGGHLVTSERSSSKLTVTRLDPRGRLGDVVGHTDTERVPRGFAVSPDARFVVAVGEESTHAQLLRLDPDGELAEVDRVPVGAGANWVRFVG